MAQNTLEIVIKANSSKAVTEIKKLDTTLNKFGASTGKGFDTLKAKWAALDAKLASPQGMKMMIGTAGAVAGALVGVGAAVKRLADDYMNYAFQVQDFGRIIGATPEEASKLIQVADDVRLSVESMTTAMRSAITKGYAPTIAELGKMSDAYLSIQDPIARSKFLIETFGRSGLEMAKLMELGSIKIDEMGKSIEGTSRLMTQEGIQKAQEYYEALDNLSDAVSNISLALGGEFAPAIANVANGIAGFATDIPPVVGMFTAMQDAMEAGAANLWDVQEALIQYFTVQKDASQITQEFANKALAAQMAIQGLSGPMFDLASGYSELSSSAGEAATSVEDTNNSIISNADIFGIASSALSDYRGETNLMQQAQDALALALGKTTTEELQLRDGVQKLTEAMTKGLTTPEEWAAMMAILADETTSATEKVNALKNMVASLASKTITITTVLRTIEYERAGARPAENPPPKLPPKTPKGGSIGGGNIGGQYGLNMTIPPGYPHDTYPIYATSGERVLIQTPAQQQTNNKNVNIINNYSIVAPALNIRELARQVTREQQREGYK